MAHIDLMDTTVLDARDYWHDHCPPGWASLPEPRSMTFGDRFLTAQGLARNAHEARRDMPVIEQGDLDALKRLLAGHMTAVARIMRPVHLFPLQREVHLDTVGQALVEHGTDGAVDHLLRTPLLVSQDHHIIDGHHRWLCGMMISAMVSVERCSLSADALLVLATGLSDREHHLRNT